MDEWMDDWMKEINKAFRFFRDDYTITITQVPSELQLDTLLIESSKRRH